MRTVNLTKGWKDRYLENDDLSEINDYDLDDETCHSFQTPTGGIIAFDTDITKYCCGLLELGELSRIDSKKVTQKEFNKLMKYLLTHTRSGALMITIVNTITAGSYTWKQYLDNCSIFKKVHTFLNPNSGNTLITYITNKSK